MACSGGEPFGCLVGDYYFDHSPQDVELLGEMAKIGAASHCPFIAGTAPSVMQMESWQELSNPRDLTKIFQNTEYAAWRSSARIGRRALPGPGDAALPGAPAVWHPHQSGGRV